MHIFDTNGRGHIVTNGNTMVVTYRKTVWKHMEHVLHICLPPCQAGYEQVIGIFDAGLVKAALSQRIDEMRKWEPTEEEHQAYEDHRANQPISDTEIERFHDEIDGGVDWDELK